MRVDTRSASVEELDRLERALARSGGARHRGDHRTEEAGAADGRRASDRQTVRRPTFLRTRSLLKIIRAVDAQLNNSRPHSACFDRRQHSIVAGP